MTHTKKNAEEILNDLHRGNRIDYQQYSDLMDAVQEIEPLRDRDEELEELWSLFGDVPMNPETECLEAPFMGWGTGIHREEIWHWFDRRHSNGVAALLYGDGVDRTPEFASLATRNTMTFECESTDCAYNHDGTCRFALVHERRPRITEDDGCTESCIDPTTL